MSADNLVRSDQRPLLPAVVGPRAARAIFRAAGVQLERYAQGLSASPLVENQEYGRELQRALASMRESVRQLQERTAAGSATGTAELPIVAGDAVSSSPPGTRLTVDQVAERTGLSPEYIRRLCRAEILSATHLGRAWSIDAESVADFKARRI